MPDPDFEYDVAFSFRSQDEATAEKIRDLLEGSVPLDRIFLYSKAKQQAELAGQDGVEAFREVFRRKSRVVVVLYRPGWGTTDWTNIEEEAIQDRRLNEQSQSFLVLVALAPTKEATPPWYPDSLIYVDLPRFGVQGAASAVLERVQGAGGSVRQETALELAERMERRRQAEEARASTQLQEGLERAREEVPLLFEEIERLRDELGPHLAGTEVVLEVREHARILRVGQVSVWVEWGEPRVDTRKESSLWVVDYRGVASFRSIVGRDAEEVHRWQFRYLLGTDGLWRWQAGDGPRRSTPELADWIVRHLVERVYAEGPGP